MTKIEPEHPLEALFSDLFHGGELTRRELRLSRTEADYLRTYARLTPLSGEAEEKTWYEVCPKGALNP